MELIRRADYETVYEYYQALKEAHYDGPENLEEEPEDRPELSTRCSTKYCEGEAAHYYTDENGCERELCEQCKNAFNMGVYYGKKGVDVEMKQMEADDE
jgi:hypothetical protein